MRALAIYSVKNSHGLHDATGAFIPEAQAFAERYKIPDKDMLFVNCVDYPTNQRREEVCSFLRNKEGVGLIGVFCHGWTTGIQVGFQKQNCNLLVRYLKMSCLPDVKIVLYACSTASNKETRKTMAPKNIGPATDGGFADTLRDTMLEQGFLGGHIDAHKTAGHTTKNPFVVRFYTEPVFEEQWDVKGGEWLVSPKSKLWRSWRSILQTDYRFQFPVLSEREIYSELI